MTVRTSGFNIITAAITLLSTSGVAATLDDLPVHKNFTAHRESSYDRNGGNFDMRAINPGETLTIADLTGAGCITHLWFTHMYPSRSSLRKLVIRAYFDGAETPCVEAPLGDFMGLGHALTYTYTSEALSVGTQGGLNSFWRMPFGKSARLTITNEGQQKCNAFYYYVDYIRYDKAPEDTACFHANYRQAMPCVKGQPYVIMEATGRGHYVGCNLSIEQGEDSWWGEGDDMFYIDGETTPSLWGTGSEDYFSGAWCYWNEFAFPYLGMPLRGRILPDGKLDRYWPHILQEDAKEWMWPVAWRTGDLWNVYRYHIADPIPFKKSLRMEIEHGYINNERQDHYSSVAYWYQDEPHAPQPKLAPVADRIPMFLRLQDRGDGLFEAEEFADVAKATEGSLNETGMTFWGKTVSRDHVLEWSPEKAGSTLTLDVPTTATGSLDVTLVAVQTRAAGTFDISVNDEVATSGVDLFSDSIFPTTRTLSLGKHTGLPDGTKITFTSRDKIAKAEAMRLLLDTVRVKPEE